MKIAITGGAGFIGSKLAEKFASAGHEVLILDRNMPRTLSPRITFKMTDLIRDIPTKEYLSCNAIIHLAGVNIFGRWNKKYKKLIASSRIETAHSLIEIVKKAGYGPKVFVSASAVGYYGDGGEQELVESSPNGKDFLSTICKDWEAVATNAETVGMRTVSVRTGIVFGPGGGMLAKLIPAFKWGLGGPMGNGQQWFSWIYIDDLLDIYERVVLDNNFRGPVNAVSPEPIRNRELAAALGRALHKPTILPLPGFALKLMLGELGDIVLMSQKVIPEKLLKTNFIFGTPFINEAITKSI